MRFIGLLSAALTFALPVFADEFVVSGRISAVTVFPDGYSFTFSADIDVPAGRHVIVMPNWPFLENDTKTGSMQVGFSGKDVALISTGSRDAGRYPVPFVETAAELAAKAELDRAKSKLRDLTYRTRGLEAEAEAARARVDYLKSLNTKGKGEHAPSLKTATEITGSTEAIGTAYLAALNAALAADRAIEEIADDYGPAERAVKVAQRAYEALQSYDREYQPVMVTAHFATPQKGVIAVQAIIVGFESWAASYELHLDQNGASGKLAVQRKAIVRLDPSSIDRETHVTLSSALIDKATAVDDPWPSIGHIFDKPVMRKTVASGSYPDADRLSEPVMEPVILEEKASFGVVSPVLKGQVLQFVLPNPITSDFENIALDTLSFDVDLTAKIVAGKQDAAYLIARMKNTSGGPLLPGTVAIFRDGVFIGEGELPGIGIGEEIELSFGEYDGIEVRRDLVEKVDVDVGIITSTNRRVLRYRTTVSSHLNFAIPVRMLDNIPVSEQEDLQITMQARPKPTEMDVKGKRGVVAWAFDLEPGSRQQIEFGYEAQWPSDKDFSVTP